MKQTTAMTLGGQQPLGVAVELDAVATDIEGQGEESVRAEIRDDGPGQEGNAVFPGEHDGRHIAALAGEPVRDAVAQVEERPERNQPAGCPSPRPVDGRGLYRGRAHDRPVYEGALTWQGRHPSARRTSASRASNRSSQCSDGRSLALHVEEDGRRHDGCTCDPPLDMSACSLYK